MAVWVDCSSNFGGWAADMGPYIGPWPLLPPGELGGLDPTHSDELDFFVALPNPADPADPTIVTDGSYDTPFWDAYRYFTGGTPATEFGYYGGVSGSTPSVPPTMPAGAHLYVIAYVFGGMPPSPPEFYVPATYAAGGAAAHETAMGHWSADQAPFTQSQQVFPFSGGDAYYYQSDEEYSGDHDVPSAVDAQIATILASTTSTSGGITPALLVTKASAENKTFVDVRASVGVTPYDGTAVLSADRPPALRALTHDVDYTETPYIGSEGEPGQPYQYDTSPGFAWTAGAADGNHDEFYDAGTTGLTLPIPIPFRFKWISGTSISGRPWTVAGSLIADVTGTPNTSGSGDPLHFFALDYSGVTDIAFTVHHAPVFLYDGSIVGLADFAMPTWPDSATLSDGPGLSQSTPTIVIDRSTWQYWVPGDVVPTGVKWHGAGGHWAANGGVWLEIYTPTATGLQWVPFVDGPA